MEINVNTYEDLLLSGHSVDYKRISLSPYERFNKTYFQVHSDDHRKLFSKFYKEVSDAVNMFVELKRSLYRGR